MKKSFLALLLLVGAAATLATMAFAQDEGIMKPTYHLLRQSLAAKAQDLRTSAASDSQFVGHSHTSHYGGGVNPWNIYTGTSRPGVWPANSALWDFDDQTDLGANGDSLQGWWPIRMPYRYARVTTATDDQRSWFAIDHGNQANYRPIMANQRTFGVVGIWHADPGNTVAATANWTPISGSKSMWCGLRALNDLTVTDAVTAAPFNESVVEYNYFGAYNAAAPIYRSYPGYGNSWDQILYRDFPLTASTALSVSFLYRTRMSTTFSTGATTRTGWFHGDPLSLTAGNFISSSAALANAPRDSFSVYIGVPADSAACKYTSGVLDGQPIFDLQRRWFDEVLDFASPYFQILGQAGSNPADTAAAAASYSATIPWADPLTGDAFVQALYDAPHNTNKVARLAFRVKTNRSWSDDDYKSGSGVLNGGYTSNGWGAVLLDDVVVDGTTYDFETGAGGVDNAIASSSLLNWKSTGRQAAIYLHPVDVAGATWNDLCGFPLTATSTCNLAGIVVSVGNASQAEGLADSRFPSMTEWIGGMMSPTVNFMTPGSGANSQGITAAMTPCSDDMFMQYEINWAAFVLDVTGSLWNFSVQVYPALTSYGRNAWSDVTGSPFRYYNTFPGCQPDLFPIKSNAMIHTSNASGIPDSIRIYLGTTTECAFFGGTNCNSNQGGYFDNISLVLANKAGADPVGPISNDIWMWFNDAFPQNGYDPLVDNVAAGSADFDTTTALVKGAVNNALTTGDIYRPSVLADSVLINASNGTAQFLGDDVSTRVDLVFRILPGPGNYEAVLGRQVPPTTSMKLLTVPTAPASFVAPGDGSFWGEYIANNGAYGTAGGHFGGTRWDYLTWNSARCDTVETNIFPVTGKAGGVSQNAGVFQSTYEDTDPHYEALGILKGICFMIDPTGNANSGNISCDTTFTKVAGNLVGDWELAATSGFDGRFSTKEYTKILPDGILTPGSHVQYFFRKSRANVASTPVLNPDTTNISPQLSESNFDGHRWQQFGVLPDRWKDNAYGGAGSACMLYIDNNDRRGDERIWVSVMDSIGGTQSAKWGAHNGWHAKGAGFGLYAPNNALISQAYVHGRNQQPGTLWDMYGVKASESASTGGTHIGNRYAPQPTGFMAGKGAAIGPKKAWLRTYYRWVSWLTGDLSLNNIGPYTNGGSDCVGLMADFLAVSGGTPQPRGIFAQGEGFAEQCNDAATREAFLNNYLFTSLAAANYTDLTGLVGCPDLISSAAVVPSGDIYGVGNSCFALMDVFNTPAGAPAGVWSAQYENPAGGPYYAGVQHTANVTYNWHSLINGWDMFNTYSRYCATSNGRLSYYYNVMVNAFGAICGGWAPTNVTQDVPNNASGRQFVNFMKVGNSVMRSGAATINFVAANDGHARIRLYDITGRVVKTIDGTYQAGVSNVVKWTGDDDAGNQVARGVYFARIEFAKGAAINGRVVVLK